MGFFLVAVLLTLGVAYGLELRDMKKLNDDE